MARCQPLRPENVALDNPCGLAVYGARLYIADTGGHRICVLEDGLVRVHAGSGIRGAHDGSKDEASFAHPCGVAVDLDGNLYVADCGNHCIRRVTPEGEVSTIAGGKESGLRDGVAGKAAFNSPCGVAINTLADELLLYVTDYSNNAVRELRLHPSLGWHVSTLATNGVLDAPYGIACDARWSTPILYVACHKSCNLVRLVACRGRPTVLAGCGKPGHINGVSSAAAFNRPNGCAVGADGMIYVTDSGNLCVRCVTPDGRVGTLKSPKLGAPSCVAVCDAGSPAPTTPRGARGGARGGAGSPGAGSSDDEDAEVGAAAQQGVLLVAARTESCVRLLPLLNGAPAAAAGGDLSPTGEARRSVISMFGSGEAAARESARQALAAAHIRAIMPATKTYAEARKEHEKLAGELELSEDCPICFDAFGETQSVRMLRCSHVFHTSCVDEWFTRANCCPCCKADCLRIA